MTDRLGLSEFLVALPEAVGVAFQTQVGMTPHTKWVSEAKVPMPVPMPISAYLDLISTSSEGFLALHFPKETYLKVISGLLGESCNEITKSNMDGASELLNILYAFARKKVNTAGFDFEPAIPKLFNESHSKKYSVPAVDILQLTCKMVAGHFYVQLHLRGRK